MYRHGAFFRKNCFLIFYPVEFGVLSLKNYIILIENQAFGKKNLTLPKKGGIIFYNLF